MLKGGFYISVGLEEENIFLYLIFFQNDELFFVHNLDPLRVMHCELDGYCEFVHNEVMGMKIIYCLSTAYLNKTIVGASYIGCIKRGCTRCAPLGSILSGSAPVLRPLYSTKKHWCRYRLVPIDIARIPLIVYC